MATPSADSVSLHHVIVLGGTAVEWADTSPEQWATLLAELGKVADHAGVRWLVLRPYGPGEAGSERRVEVGGCLVVAAPEGDGRRRLAAAVSALHSAGAEISESSIDLQLNEPAETDPDLVVVLGPPHRFPGALVWELAYSELVFVDTPWQHFAASQLGDAMATFAHRHRRFGGVD